MSVKLKITVDPALDGKEVKFGYRPETFFIKLPDYVYGTLLSIAEEQGITFNQLFLNILSARIKEGQV